MKNLSLRFSLLLFALALFSVTACKKTDEVTDTPTPTTPPPTPTDTTIQILSASIGASGSFAADTTTITHEYDADLGMHIFMGYDQSGDHGVTFAMSDITVGTHDIDFDNTIVTWQDGASVYTGGFNPQGEVVITKNDGEKISGHFNATVFNFDSATTIEITSGVFQNISIE